MVLVIHSCDSTANFSPDYGTISTDTVDIAPITPNSGCLLWTNTASPTFSFLRLNQSMDLSSYNILRFWHKTSDAAQNHSIQIRTDYMNFNTYDFSTQLKTGTWVLVAIDLTKPTSTTGTMNWASIGSFIWTMTNASNMERIDEIEADVSIGTTYTLTIQANAGGTTNPAPNVYGPYAPGTLEIVQAVANAGFAFTGWTLDGQPAGTVNPYSVTMNTNHTIIASFTSTTGTEQMLYHSNFAGGSIAPFGFTGDATTSYTVLTAAQDPLNAGNASCKLAETTESTRASLAIIDSANGAIGFGGTASGGWTVYGSIRIKTTQMRPDTAVWTGVAAIRHPALYGSGSSFYYAILDIFNGTLRLQYYNNGGMSEQEWTSGAGLPVANVAEQYELYVKTGVGNGVVTLSKNGTVIFSDTAVQNSDMPVSPPGGIGSIEVGTSWGGNPSVMYIYNITVSGTPFIPFPTSSVSGTFVDVNGTPIPYVGVRVGADISTTSPWLVNWSWKETYADVNGNFSYTDNPNRAEPIVRFVKLGYGDPSWTAGSVTEIAGGLTSPASGNLNLGKITLQTRAPIPVPTFAEGTYWPLRALTLFGYSKPYGSAAFNTQLSLIKSKNLPYNMIQIRTQTVGATGSALVVDNDPSSAYCYSAVLAGIDMIHAQGFEAMISINGYNSDAGYHIGVITPDPAWMTAYKACVLQVAQGCITHNVEWLMITFENYTFAGQETAAWIDIMNSVRALIAATPGCTMKVGATMNLIGYTNYSSWQIQALADKAFWEMCDFIHYENWTRLSTVIDGTEEMVSSMWHASQSWDDYHPDYTLAFPWIKSQYPNALLIMNNGFCNNDACLIYPWGTSLSKIQNQEMQALGYKATFDVYQNVALDGWNMEHYSFDQDIPTEVNNNFVGMYTEQFIIQGLLAHANAPPQNTATITGVVTDTASTPLANATVTCNGASTTTDSTGTYIFTGLTPAVYTVTATAAGYQSNSVSVTATTAGSYTAPLIQLAVSPTPANNYSWLILLGLAALVIAGG